MAQYIDKSALVAEIEKLRDDVYQCSSYDEATGFQHALGLIKSFIDNLEVKEVDLEKEIEKCLKQHSMLAVGKKDFTDIAKHFFELGHKMNQKGENI